MPALKISVRGGFNQTHGAVMGGHAVKSAIAKAGIEPGAVEDVFMGCGMPEGATGAKRADVTRPRPGHADLAGAIKYGHTDVRDVLERYRRIGARIYRTDLDGALLLELSAAGVTVQRYRALYRRYWHSPLENADLADEADEQLSAMQF